LNIAAARRNLPAWRAAGVPCVAPEAVKMTNRCTPGRQQSQRRL